MNTFMTIPLIRGTNSNAAWMIHRPSNSESVCCTHTVYMQKYTVNITNVLMNYAKVYSYRHIIIIEGLVIYNGHGKLRELKLNKYVYYTYVLYFTYNMVYTVLIFSIYFQFSL